MSKERQAEINKLFQEYKKGFRLAVAELTTEGIKQAQVIEFPDEEYIEIPAYDFTEEEYLEHKRKCNERAYKKFGVEYKEEPTMTQEQLRQQRELHEDLLLELRY